MLSLLCRKRFPTKSPGTLRKILCGLCVCNQATAQICIQSNDEYVNPGISDNGKDFDPHQTQQGIGLENIHERTQFYNGAANIQASAGKGCNLTVTIPVK